ncbi:hypothetical protein ACFFWC_21855 [Plantactinospora siamensis]|uniref:Uncharacterized protein n=1 Tax=Plantactinospora siamensis TaxID=555372 RepID=A0ABV6P5G6_9ACTN
MLHRNGITVTAGRNTARAALASGLPASVLADLTGTHVQTAVAWTRLTGRDWTDYVAKRAHDSSAAPGPS